MFLKDAAKQLGAQAAEAKLSSVESLSAMFASESADWQQQQQQQQLQQQQLTACGGVFKCVEALAQNIPRLQAALTSNLESLDCIGPSCASVALALHSCEELQALTRDFERLLGDAVQAVVAATRPRFSGAFDLLISSARVPAAAATPGGANDASKGQSAACLHALGSVDTLYVLFKSALPEAVVDSIMMFILQVCFPCDLFTSVLASLSIDCCCYDNRSIAVADRAAASSECPRCPLGGGAFESQKGFGRRHIHAGCCAAAGLRRSLRAVVLYVEAKGQRPRVAAGDPVFQLCFPRLRA